MTSCDSRPDWLSSLLAQVRDRAPPATVSGILCNLGVGKLIYASRRHSKDCFVALAEVCIYVRDESTATQTLSLFARDVLDKSTAPWFEQLRHLFGIDWFRDWWSQCAKWGTRFDFTLDLVTQFDVDLLGTVFDTYEWTENQKTFSTMEAVLKACFKVRGVPIVPEKWVHQIEMWKEEDSFPVLEMAQFLEHYYFHVEGLEEVKKLVMSALDAELNSLDNPGWSLNITTTTTTPTTSEPNAIKVCSCYKCGRVVQFAQDKRELKLVFRIEIQFRNHIMSRWQNLGLPLEWNVDKSVRPWALVIVKQWWLPDAWPRRNRYLECVRCWNALFR